MNRIVNFRPLAEGMKNKRGKQIKPNTIFRSGLLYFADDEDKQRLKEYGIKTIIDLRGRDEQINMPALSSDDFDTHRIDILAGAEPRELYTNDASAFRADDMKRMMDKLYSDSFVNTDRFSGALDLIHRNIPKQFLFHCTAGRDRTGILGAILMMIMDFDTEEIIEEYTKYDHDTISILTKLVVEAMKAEGIDMDEHSLMQFIYPSRSSIETFLEAVIATHLTFDSYLLETFGLRRNIREDIKNAYLE